jgi:hypothetical protein
MATQALGSHMRQNQVELFRYISARDKNKGKNMALFSPKAFHNEGPSELTTWFCQTSIEEVGFFSKEHEKRITYLQKDFWVDELFPSPAI